MDFKCSIDYKVDKKIRSLYIFLPKPSAYRKYFDKTNCMFFFKLSEKYNEIWSKKSATLSKNNLVVKLYIMK